MALTRQGDSSITYLQVKDYSIWQEIKKQVEGCDTIEVTNPRTKEILTKHGYKFKSVEGLVTALTPYANDHDGVRYSGFKLLLEDVDAKYSLDMASTGQLLRRFLRCAPNFDWSIPLKISAFKSKKENPNDSDSTGIWFQQNGETVPPYYTRQDPHGMPEAIHDADGWDFKPQTRWLIEQLKAVTIPAIEAAARASAPPRHEGDEPPNDFTADDSDCPF